MRIIPTNEAWKSCPRADECDCNDCPLLLKKYTSSKDDPTSRCSFGKTGRMRIGKEWKLENLGLKSKELASYKNWHNLSEEEKKSKIDKLRLNSTLYNHSNDRGIIHQEKKIILPESEQNEEKYEEITKQNDFLGEK